MCCCLLLLNHIPTYALLGLSSRALVLQHLHYDMLHCNIQSLIIYMLAHEHDMNVNPEVACDGAGYTGSLAGGNCGCADGYDGCGWTSPYWNVAQGTYASSCINEMNVDDMENRG